jgi:hypothetical protein
MSAVAMRTVFEQSRSTGAARLVLLCLASYVAHEKWKRGEPPLAFPSQRTIAERCNCSRSTVQLALRDLERLGEICDTGERRGGRGGRRGPVVWELLLDDMGVGDEWTDPRPNDEDDERTDLRSSAEEGRGPISGGLDRSPGTAGPILGPLPDRPSGQRGLKEGIEEEGKTERGRAASRPDASSIPPAPEGGCVSHPDAPVAGCRYCRKATR